jgi:WhiB family transcriptional regulator, redox-sensing transcriptional regulator
LVITVADIRRLPGPVSDVWDWQMHGSCRGMDSGVFFHPEGERGPARANRERRAKEICASCPVLELCRRHALEVHEPYGVWGGLSEAERDDLVRGRTRELKITGGRAPRTVR